MATNPITSAHSILNLVPEGIAWCLELVGGGPVFTGLDFELSQEDVDQVLFTGDESWPNPAEDI